MPSLLENLNPEQLAAVTLPDQSALILAGAGSGKTRVLTTRIAWLIQTGNVSPNGVLAVTFTNKAAKEMLTRISAMLPINTRGMWVGTFHGLCNRLLRAHYRDAGLPQLFQILDSQDQHAAVKRVLKALNVDEERFPAREAQYFINAEKEEGRRARDVEATDEITRRLAEIYAAYLQYRWLKLLAGPKNIVFAVGDDDQSIYRFRGAHVGNMAEFERDFRVENVIRLEQNYRSHGHILAAANALIAHNRKRLGKNLWTSAGHGEPVRVYEAQSDGYEASWLVEEIQALHRGGLRLADMAILYRSNAQSRIIEHALFSNGMPYRVYGGLRFFERMEIKHALAYLRLAANPDDDGAFLRVVNFPARGVGARTLEQLQDAAKAGGTSLYKAAAGLSGKSGAAVAAFVRLVDSLKAETQGLRLPETVEGMLERSGLVAHYKSERDGADRVENLNELVNAAAAFVSEEEDHDLPAFLSHAALESGENQAAEGADALQLMTVHSAKGLEFHAVFITGLEEGLFPHEQSVLEDDGLEEERRLMYVAITRARTRLYLSFAQTRMLHGQTRYNVASRFLDELPEGVVKRLTPRMGREKFDKAAWAPAPAKIHRAKVPGHGFRIGQSVLHPKFGQGVIVNAEGSGPDARLQINFGKQGMKWLAIEYAKLTSA